MVRVKWVISLSALATIDRFLLSEYSEDQLKIMTIQDGRYLNYKRQVERKKIEKLKASLHMIDADSASTRKHTFFVDKKVRYRSHLHNTYISHSDYAMVNAWRVTVIDGRWTMSWTFELSPKSL